MTSLFSKHIYHNPKSLPESSAYAYSRLYYWKCQVAYFLFLAGRQLFQIEQVWKVQASSELNAMEIFFSHSNTLQKQNCSLFHLLRFNVQKTTGFRLNLQRKWPFCEQNLPYTESSHWSFWLSTAYIGWQRFFGISDRNFWPFLRLNLETSAYKMDN